MNRCERRFGFFCPIILCSIVYFVFSSSIGAITPGNMENRIAVKEVSDGKRTIANASWWGFDEYDATECLQSAIDSGAKRVIIPNMTKDWIVKPIKLEGDQELIFENGAVITAKRGEFRGKEDCLFSATNISNLTIRGYGAIWGMQKQDYMENTLRDYYTNSEWRHSLKLSSCENIKVYGLTVRDSGGDGIYIGSENKEQPYCKNIHIRDVVCDNHYRQGISVIGAENLLIENCVFKNTWGTSPSAGIDFEPNLPTNILVNCVVRNCFFEDNWGRGILIVPIHHEPADRDISLLFENCRVSGSKGKGIVVAWIDDSRPNGSIEFKDCFIENVESYGLYLANISPDGADVRFRNCTWRNIGKGLVNKDFLGVVDKLETIAPILINFTNPDFTDKNGGVQFLDCIIEDTNNRPFIASREKENEDGICDLSGTITVRNPYGAVIDLGENTHNVTLKIIEER
ncbi:right-handed parallel beta-helix repeat-containing protein [Candidatus Latescibacterota bacterium]